MLTSRWWLYNNDDIVEQTNLLVFNISAAGHAAYMGSGVCVCMCVCVVLWCVCMCHTVYMGSGAVILV